MHPDGVETIAADPADALRRLEEAAERDPADRSVAAAVLAVADRIAAENALPAVVGGVRRDALVRWDAISATFVGVDVASGSAAMVRALRPEAARDPVLRRHFGREAKALGAVVPVVADGDALRIGLVGLPLSAVRGEGLARAVATGIAAVARWHDAGLGVPDPAPDELRVADGTVTVACLTAVAPDPAPALAALARGLVHHGDDGPIALAVRTIAEGVGSPGAAADVVRRAMAEALTARRHDLASRWRTEWHRSRHARLHAAVARLARATPPPSGAGAVGVDLDGRITVVEVRGAAVLWGPEGGAEVVADGEGVRAPVARRLVRAHAASPPNRVLQARVGGDQERVDAIVRWTAAALQLRTVRLLLEKESS